MRSFQRFTFMAALAAVVFLLGLPAVPANAVTFYISFTQDGVGDAGPDWFGTFEAPDGGGKVTSFSATIGGTTFYIPDPDFGPFLDPTKTFVFNNNPLLLPATKPGIVLQEDLSAAFQVALSMHNNNSWAFDSCNNAACNHGSFVGTYSISDVAPVPLPAALPLFATILAGGGLIAWRRKRKAAAASAA